MTQDQREPCAAIVSRLTSADALMKPVSQADSINTGRLVVHGQLA